MSAFHEHPNNQINKSIDTRSNPHRDQSKAMAFLDPAKELGQYLVNGSVEMIHWATSTSGSALKNTSSVLVTWASSVMNAVTILSRKIKSALGLAFDNSTSLLKKWIIEAKNLMVMVAEGVTSALSLASGHALSLLQSMTMLAKYSINFTMEKIYQAVSALSSMFHNYEELLVQDINGHLPDMIFKPTPKASGSSAPANVREVKVDTLARAIIFVGPIVYYGHCIYFGESSSVGAVVTAAQAHILMTVLGGAYVYFCGGQQLACVHPRKSTVGELEDPDAALEGLSLLFGEEEEIMATEQDAEWVGEELCEEVE